MSEVYKLELEMWRLFMETKTVRMAQIPERVCRLKKKKKEKETEDRNVGELPPLRAEIDCFSLLQSFNYSYTLRP